MTYDEARKRVRVTTLLGVAIWSFVFIVTLIICSKSLYGGPLTPRLLTDGIEWAYQNIPLVPTAWEFAPAIDVREHPLSSGVVIAMLFLGFWIAHETRQSANGLAARLRRIDEDIENELIRTSISPGQKRTLAQIRHEVVVPQPSSWEIFHNRYLAPFLVGLVLLVLGIVLNVS